jgi:predicted AAA+ superfamily ATPase
MFKRSIHIDLPRNQSAFLWGARQTGKSTYLRQNFGNSVYYDLLKWDLYFKLLKEPSRFREELLRLPEAKLKNPIIVDEVQKIPPLLDEIHGLIEDKKLQFILCGSNARKLKRAGSNLLGGRAWRFEMKPLTFPEIPEFDLLKALSIGLLPAHYVQPSPRKSLNAYVCDYLREEIRAEGLVRNLPAFSRFLDAAVFSHGAMINFTNIGSDCGIDVKTVKEYFEILKDSYIGYFLHPLSRKLGRKTITSVPKFYFFDSGVANNLAKVELRALKGDAAGKSFEGYIFHELHSYRSYRELDFEMNYWRTTSQLEIDFVLDEGRYLIETTISDRIKATDLHGLKAFLSENPAKRALLVCLEKMPRKIEISSKSFIEVLPWKTFLEELWNDEIIK